MAFTLPQSMRLRSFGRLRRLFTEGKGGFIYPFRYKVYAEPSDEPQVQVLFSTPKKFHRRAVRRNLLRRRMREAWRLNQSIVTESGKQGNIEVALIYSTKEVLDYKTIETAVQHVMEAIVSSL